MVCCETCPRVFHLKCAQLTADPPGDWVCIECRRVVQAETVDNLSPAMKMLTHEQFTLLLKHAIGRLKGLPGVSGDSEGGLVAIHGIYWVPTGFTAFTSPGFTGFQGA